MQMLAEFCEGIGQALGVAVDTVELATVEPRTPWTDAPIRESVRQPVPVALEVDVVPEQGWLFTEPNGWSAATAAATAWRAPRRAASAGGVPGWGARRRAEAPRLRR